MNNTTSRFIGLDLCRGLAAFAVILVHSGDETWGLPISDRAIQFRYLFYFAVPFFLAASFYLGTRKSPLKISATFWQKKFQRIIVPYLLWSMIYVVLKVVIFSLTNDAEQIQKLLSDPVAIVFFGRASYHLYFIPLLISGTIWLYLANYLNGQQNSVVLLSILSTVSIVGYQTLLIYDGNFALGSYIAFPQILEWFSPDSLFYQPWRIILVNLAWIIRCAPYFFLALLSHQLLRRHSCKWLYLKKTSVAIFLLFLLLNIAGERHLPAALYEIAIAYTLLFFGISISRHLPDSSWIANLGLCSFGIYLIHPFVKSAVEILLVKFLPQVTQSVSIGSIVLYSTSSFLISWLVISLMQRNKLVAQYV